ncbi:hypothetical protein TYRP_005329 [Tyrophagus putrescentiae]|nr:hypothetical protein TYRP_005329 [Tyrophagus putrescentiae]
MTLQTPQPPDVPPLTNNTETLVSLVCGPNQTSVSLRNPYYCYVNCQNKDRPPKPCQGISFPGPFCECKKGYIFLYSTTSNCVKPEDCLKPACC